MKTMGGTTRNATHKWCFSVSGGEFACRTSSLRGPEGAHGQKARVLETPSSGTLRGLDVYLRRRASPPLLLMSYFWNGL